MFKSKKVVGPKHSLGLYRESNSPAGLGLKYPGESLWTYFYFDKNVQGDVIGLYRSDYSSSTGATTAAAVDTTGRWWRGTATIPTADR